MRQRLWKYAAVVGTVLAGGGLLLVIYVNRSMEKGAYGLQEALHKPAVLATLWAEIDIGKEVQRYHKEKRIFPSSVESLRIKEGSRTDPWGNDFIIKQIGQDRFVIQSLGRVGKDMLGPSDVDRLGAARPSSWYEIGGNIVMVASFTEPLQLQVRDTQFRREGLFGEPLDRKD